MRILINAISAKTGGIVTYTRNLIAALEERGIDFLIAVPTSFPAHARTLPVEASDYSPFRRLVWEQTVWRRMVKHHKPDVLFSSANFGLLNSPVPQVLLVREGGLFDPLYMSCVAPTQGLNSAIMRNLRRRLILASARQTDHVFTPTSTMRDMLLAWAPDLAERCTVNSYGTLVKMFERTERRKWRQDGVLRALYVSVYYPHKNPMDAVQACEILNGGVLATKLRLTMDVNAIRRLRGSSSDLFYVERGIADGLVEVGQVAYADLPQLYGASDVFVFPSVSETFGHPMIEALSSGLPVVAADVPVNREVLGEAALYYSPHRATALADCLRRLDSDENLRHTLVESGRRRAGIMFDWNDHVDRLLNLFEQLASGSGRSGR